MPNASWTIVQYDVKARIPIWGGVVVKEPSRIPVYASRSANLGIVNVAVNTAFDPTKPFIPIYGTVHYVPDNVPTWESQMTWPIIVRVWNHIVQFVDVCAQFVQNAFHTEITAQINESTVDTTISAVTINEPVNDTNIFAAILTSDWEYKIFWEARGDMKYPLPLSFSTFVIKDTPLIKFYAHTQSLQVKPVAYFSVLSKIAKDFQAAFSAAPQTLTRMALLQASTREAEYQRFAQGMASVVCPDLEEIISGQVNVVDPNLMGTSLMQIMTREETLVNINAKASLINPVYKVFGLMKVSVIEPYLAPVLNLIKVGVGKNMIRQVRSHFFGLMSRAIQTISGVAASVAPKRLQHVAELHATIECKMQRTGYLYATTEFVSQHMNYVHASLTLHVDKHMAVLAQLNQTFRDMHLHTAITLQEKEVNVFFDALHIKRNTWLYASGQIIRDEIFVNWDVMTMVNRADILLDLLPRPMNYKMWLLMSLHQVKDLAFLAFSINELKITTKLEMTIHQTVVRAIVQWFLQRGTVDNEGFSNEVIFDLNSVVPIIPEPPSIGQDWNGGYVEYPFYGMGQESTDKSSGYNSAEADKWVQNASMFFGKAQQVFDDKV